MTRRAPRATRAERLQSLMAKVAAPKSGARAEVQAPDADQPDAGNTAELWLYGIVGGYWFGFNAKTVADALRGLDVDHLTVRLHSPGGNVVDGIAIANLLRNHKARVTIVVDGLAASIASVIATAGDDIVMSPGAQLMVHDAWMLTIGNEKELRQDADHIGKQSTNLAELYAHRGGQDAPAWRAAMTAEPDGTWYTAQEAVTAGLADRVGTVTAVSAAPEPPEEDGFEDDDEMAARASLDLEFLITPAARAAWPYKPPTASAGGTTQPEGAAVVDFNDTQITALREQLGFPADADADTIVAAMTEALEERADTPPAPAPTTPVIPEGMQLIDGAVLAQLQAGAVAGQTAQQTLAGQQRDTAISTALAAGKIAATSRAQFEKAWDKDAAGTQALLDVLAPGLVPVAEVGHSNDPDQPSGLDIDDDDLAVFAAGLGLTKEALRG